MIQYYCGYGKYGNISEWYSPFHNNEWVRDKCWKMFKDRGHELASPVETYSMEDLLWHCEQLKKPTKITVKHEQPFPRIIGFEWDAPIVAALPKPEPLILDDEIPW